MNGGIGLAPKAAERLAKIAGMLGSNHPGEVFNAAQLATGILREHGLTWQTLVLRPIVAAPPARPQNRPAPRYEPTSWRVDAAACLRRPDLLTAWERAFVVGLARFPRLSTKQAAVLARLVERVCTAGGAP